MMKMPPLSPPLRSRLLIGGALIQIGTLALLTAVGIHVMDAQLAARARLQVEEQKRLLAAAVEGPLRRGDYRSIATALERLRREDDMPYLVLYGADGKVLAANS